MLAELLVWAGVAASPSARRLGYARSAVSLWSRRRRCAAAWREHEINSRRFVLDFAESCRHRDSLWLLGAGLLADIPLAELSAMFRHVLVFDIALLAQARRKIRRFGNVELRLADITGIVAPLAEWRAGMPLPIPSDEALRDLDPVPPDGIVSLNILSQLPLLPIDYLRRRNVPQQAAEDFGRQIIRAHLDGLASLSCPVALVSDALRIWRNKAGEPVMDESALLGMRLPSPVKEWNWLLAPRGEIDPATALELRVHAVQMAS
ncbi:MAG TPA: hypothetical protein VF194_05630 [Ferrovibrio sp.]|jgi:hypothetical protein|uniref:hypothetical protein n=1 Tax=Ferrovibrio sp. TaxID=1917215 RepID=UPI002ED409B4